MGGHAGGGLVRGTGRGAGGDGAGAGRGHGHGRPDPVLHHPVQQLLLVVRGGPCVVAVVGLGVGGAHHGLVWRGGGAGCLRLVGGCGARARP